MGQLHEELPRFLEGFLTDVIYIENPADTTCSTLITWKQQTISATSSNKCHFPIVMHLATTITISLSKLEQTCISTKLSFLTNHLLCHNKETWQFPIYFTTKTDFIHATVHIGVIYLKKLNVTLHKYNKSDSYFKLSICSLSTNP